MVDESTDDFRYNACCDTNHDLSRKQREEHAEEPPRCSRDTIHDHFPRIFLSYVSPAVEAFSSFLGIDHSP